MTEQIILENNVTIKDSYNQTVEIPYIFTTRKFLAQQNACFHCNKIISSDGNVYIDRYGIFYCSLNCMIESYA